MTRNRIYPIEERLDALGKGKDQTDEQVEGRVVRRMMEDISESHRDAPAKDRRVSNFKPLDPCLAVLYVKLKPGESLTVKAPTIAGDGVLVFRDRRLKGE